MRLPDLLIAVRRVLRDPDIEDAELIDYANEVLAAAARRVFLPDLEAAAVVVVPAGAMAAPLPGDFQRELFSARNSDGHMLRVTGRGDIERLRRTPPSAGTIQVVAAAGEGTLLVWPPSQSDAAVFLGYFRRPHTLEQTAGEIAFAAATRTLSATDPVFRRLRPGDTFTTDSVANSGSFTVVSATETTCVVAEVVVDAAASLVNIAATAIEGIPFEQRRNLLVNGVLALAYETKEDARDSKPNCDRFRTLTETAMPMRPGPRRMKRASTPRSPSSMPTLPR